MTSNLREGFIFLLGNILEISGAATALFTGVMAFLAWRESKRTLITEWDFENAATLQCRVTIRNNLAHSIRPIKIESSPKFTTALVPSSGEKHTSWPAHVCPSGLLKGIEPGSSASFSFKFTPDWDSVRSRQQQWPHRLHRFAVRAAWKLLSARVHHGASVHFCITIDSNVSTSFRKRIKATKRLTLDAAEKHIAVRASHQSQL